jgi:hypothetical protein
MGSYLARFRRSRIAMTALLASALLASPAAAQTDKQLWGELTLDWIKSHTITLGVDAEPKVLVSKAADEPGWTTLDVTPKIEYARGKWFDIVGELHLGRTRQTDEQNSFEVTPRIGFRFHLLSNLVDDLIKERQPRRRLASAITLVPNGAISITPTTRRSLRRCGIATASKPCFR